jgi:hypothetical protein
MDFDLHGSGLAVVMLTLGILVVRYSDVLVKIGYEVFETIGLVGSISLVTVLMVAAVLVGSGLRS